MPQPPTQYQPPPQHIPQPVAQQPLYFQNPQVRSVYQIPSNGPNQPVFNSGFGGQAGMPIYHRNQIWFVLFFEKCMFVAQSSEIFVNIIF